MTSLSLTNRVSTGRQLGCDDIRRLLPHTFPFLFVDRVDELEPLKRARGLKNVSLGEPFFAGHFPHESIMPGVLIVEALAQLAGIVIASAVLDGSVGGETDDERRRVPTRCYLAQVRRMRFRHVVRPGDQLRLEAVRTGFAKGLMEFQVSARVGKPVAEGSLVVATDVPSTAGADSDDNAGRHGPAGEARLRT